MAYGFEENKEKSDLPLKFEMQRLEGVNRIDATLMLNSSTMYDTESFDTHDTVTVAEWLSGMNYFIVSVVVEVDDDLDIQQKITLLGDLDEYGTTINVANFDLKTQPASSPAGCDLRVNLVKESGEWKAYATAINFMPSRQIDITLEIMGGFLTA